MGNANRSTQLSVIELLQKCPQKFTYEQCVFILEKKYNYDVNKGAYFSTKIATQGQHKLCISAYDVNGVKINKDRAIIYAERMSFTSFTGPLPSIYSERLAISKWTKDPALSEFMNIFINRLSVISYRISVRKTPALQKVAHCGQTSVGRCINALLGNSNNDSLFAFCYSMWNIPRSALGLRTIISNFFNIDVNIEQFYGAKTKILDITVLGKINSFLGENTILGSSYFDYGSAIEITLGPLPDSSLELLKPGMLWRQKLEELINRYLPQEIDYDVVLMPANAQHSTIGRNKLAYDTWL